MFIFNLHCQLVLRISGNMLHISTSQRKIPIVPEQGWFGHNIKRHSRLCRFLLLYSSFTCEADYITIDPTYTSRIIVSVACFYNIF